MIWQYQYLGQQLVHEISERGPERGLHDALCEVMDAVIPSIDGDHIFQEILAEKDTEKDIPTGDTETIDTFLKSLLTVGA